MVLYFALIGGLGKGTVQDVVVQNGYGFLAAGRAGGLNIVNLQDVTVPTMVTSYNTLGTANRVAIFDKYLYLLDGNQGVRIFDISEVNKPRPVGIFYPPGKKGRAEDIFFSYSEQRGYLAYGEMGMFILNLDHPENPAVVGHYDTPGTSLGIAVERREVVRDDGKVQVGKFVYIADGKSGLRIIDVGNPKNPEEIGNYPTKSSANAVVLLGPYSIMSENKKVDFGPYALLAAGDEGVLAIDVSNPRKPSLVASYDTAGVAYSFALQQGGQNKALLYVADGAAGLQILNVAIDFSDSKHPVNIDSFASFPTQGLAKRSAIYENNIYVACDTGGLQVLSLQNLKIVTMYPDPNSSPFVDVALFEKFAYLAVGGNSGGLRVIRVDNINEPMMTFPNMPNTGISGAATGIEIANGNVYLADWQVGLRVFSLTDPLHPREIGVLKKENAQTEDIYVSKNFAYLASGASGLNIINVSIPDQPFEVNTVDTPGVAHGVIVANEIAFVADGPSGLQIFDVKDPKKPNKLGEVRIPGDDARRVVLAGTNAVVAAGEAGVWIVNVSDPTQPKLIGAYDTPGHAQSLTLLSNLVFVSDGEAGIRALDISSPTHPVDTTPVLQLDTSGYAHSLALDNSGNIYVADDVQGLGILRLRDLSEIAIYRTPGEAGIFPVAVELIKSLILALVLVPLGKGGEISTMMRANYDVWSSYVTLRNHAFICLIGFIVWGIFFTQFVLPVQTIWQRIRVARHLLIYSLGLYGKAIHVENGAIKENWRDLGRLKKNQKSFIYSLLRLVPGFTKLVTKGSGVIVLDSASAGVLRNQTRFIRSVGPGVEFTGPDEQLASPVDLGLQTRFIGPKPGEECFSSNNEVESESCWETRALTRDGVTIVPNIIVIFRLESEYGEGGTGFGYDPRSVWLAVAHEGINPDASRETNLRYVPWDRIPERLAVDVWREYLQKFTLNELFSPSVSDPLNPEAEKKTGLEIILAEVNARLKQHLVNKLDPYGDYVIKSTEEIGRKPSCIEQVESREYVILKERGIEVLAVVITNLRLPREIDNQIVERWKIAWERKVQERNVEIERIRHSRELAGTEDAISTIVDWASELLYEKLSSDTDLPDVTGTLELLIQGIIDKGTKDLELRRRMNHEIDSLVGLASWLRKQT